MPDPKVGPFIWEIDRQIESALTTFVPEGHELEFDGSEDFLETITNLRIQEKTVFDFVYDKDKSFSENIQENLEEVKDILLQRLNAQQKDIEQLFVDRYEYAREELIKRLSSAPNELIDKVEQGVKDFSAKIDATAKRIVDQITGKLTKPKIKQKTDKYIADIEASLGQIGMDRAGEDFAKRRAQTYINKFEGDLGLRTAEVDFGKKRAQLVHRAPQITSKFVSNIDLPSSRIAKRPPLDTIGTVYDPLRPDKTEAALAQVAQQKEQKEKYDVVRTPESIGDDYKWGSTGYINEYHDFDKTYKESINKELRFPITHKDKPTLNEINNRSILPFYFIDLRSNNYCYFNAILTQLGDNFNPQWSRETFFGRSEGLSHYTSTDRDIPVSFSMIAETQKDLIFIYKKLEWLAQTTYPSYNENDTTQFMDKPPLIRMRIGDVIKSGKTGLAGYITGLGYVYDLDSGWEVSIQGLKVPKKVDVSFGFTVIHDKMPSDASTFYDINTSFGGTVETDIRNIK